ncbi:uncharacterized protein LOC135083405 [Ostrinia nubilalis]|uniref:uncharacterized protein LOC135083405 n=1 Tax=Ostrinia nubilalis TaxID=29057 RepID=UPI0030823EB6
MSLLEDVFLEDEAGEAQELERVIEGDEYDERPQSPNSDDSEEKEDEAEEDKRRVDPTQAKAKRIVKNPRFILNPARLTGPRGIQVIPDHFKDFKFKGKGHEKEDLDMVLKKLEHWAYRLYPKFGFHDCLKKIETLGKKKAVMVHLHKIRSDQITSEEPVTQQDSSDDEGGAPQEEDEFDKLLQQQIDIARATPAPASARKAPQTPSVDRSLMMPKATSSPSISDEQRERMLRNRRLAEERRLAKLKNDNSVAENPDPIPRIEVIDEVVTRKHNRSNVIDSSDEDDSTVNQSITVDVHSKVDEMEEDINDNDEENIIDKKNNTEVITEPDNSMEAATEVVSRKCNKSNVIDSSDDEDDAIVNQSVADVNNKVDKIDQLTDTNQDNKVNDTEDLSHTNTINNSDKKLDTSIGDNIKNTEQNNSGTENELDNEETMSDRNSDIRLDENELIQNKEHVNSDIPNNAGELSNTDNVDSKISNETTAIIDKDVLEDVMDVDFTDDF